MKAKNHAPKLPNTATQFIWNCVKSFPVSLTCLLIFEAGLAICQIMLPKAIQKIIDGAVAAKQGITEWTIFQDELTGPIMLFIGLNMGILFTARISGAFMAWLDPELKKYTQKNLYHYLQYHSQNFFLNNFSGSLAKRISETSVSLNYTLWVLWFDFWPILITFIASMILLASVHSGLAFFLAGWITLYVLISYFLGKKCQNYAEKYAEKRSLVTGKIVDGVSNILNAKLFSHLKYEREYLNKYLNEEIKHSRKTHWFMEKIRWFNFSAALILQVSMLLYALKVWSSGGITVGEFGMATTLTILIINEAQNLSRRFLEYFEYLGNVSDGIQAIVKPHEVLDKPNAQSLKVSYGEIEFKNVDFQYNENKMIYQGLSTKIHAGEKVALVGYSGSGKSTFINLILRLFEYQRGSICIDGQNIQQVIQDSLRAQIGVIPQEPMLFNRTLMENIRYGNLLATDEQVVLAAKAAHAHDFISHLEKGYQTEVGERGVKLSGGQRQRIVIARAILKNAPILILDEATASLDSQTESNIQNSIEHLIDGKTVLVVAHRLSTIAHMDRILVFDQGKIIEDGTHHELLILNGHYAKLWRMQAGGFLPHKETLDLTFDQSTLGM